MWRRLVPSGVRGQLSSGAELLRATPGSRVLLGGAVVTGILTLVLHPQGLASGALRVALAVPVIILFLAASGELARVRRDVRQMRALLRSAAPRQDPLSRRQHVLMAGLCVVFGVSRSPRGEQVAGDGYPQEETGCAPRGKRRGKRGRPTGVGAVSSHHARRTVATHPAAHGGERKRR